MAHVVYVLRDQAWRAQRGRCAYCLRPIGRKETTADHRLPRSRGGKYERVNIAAACGRCNHTKGDQTDQEFFRLINGDGPVFVSMEILSIWISRRIWKRANQACRRILRSAR